VNGGYIIYKQMRDGLKIYNLIGAESCALKDQ